MTEQQRIEAAEQALYESSRASQALRSVAFLLGETQGGGPSDWAGQPVEDLTALLGILADHGATHAEAGLEALQGASRDRLSA